MTRCFQVLLSSLPFSSDLVAVVAEYAREPRVSRILRIAGGLSHSDIVRVNHQGQLLLANGQLRVVDAVNGTVLSLIGELFPWWTSCGMACDTRDGRVFGASRGHEGRRRDGRAWQYQPGDVTAFHSDGTLAAQFKGAAHRTCALCVHGNEMFVCGDRTVSVFGLDDGRRKRVMGRVYAVRDCIASAYGELFVASCATDAEVGRVSVLATDDGRLLRQFADQLWLSALTLDSTQNLVLAVDDQQRRLHAFLRCDGTPLWDLLICDDVGRSLSARSICMDSVGQLFVLEDGDRVVVFDL